METHDQSPPVTTVFVDRLSFTACAHLVRLAGMRHVVVLEKIRRRQEIWATALRLTGISVSEGVFFAGHLKTDGGECVYFASRRLANTIALKAARAIVESDRDLSEVNREHGRNTLRLFIAKQLSRHVEQWTSRILIAQSLSSTERCLLLVARPQRFAAKLLDDVSASVTVLFYSDPIAAAVDLLREIVLTLLRVIKQKYAFRFHHDDIRSVSQPTLLMIQEESLRASNHLRNQFYFLNGDKPGALFETVVLKPPNQSLFQNQADPDSQRLSLLPMTALGAALREFRNNKTIQRLRANRWKLVLQLSRARSYPAAWFLFKAAWLLWHAEMMGALSLKKNVKAFVTKEPYSTHADAIQLVARDLNITTIALQYSNTPFVSPGMMSTADKYVVFSEMYQSVFSADDIAPGEYVTNGYLYDGIAESVSGRAANRRCELERHGAMFVLCYFDESVQHDRWGLVSTGDHLGELHVLAQAVLDDPQFGLVVKSQFMRNSPSQLYPADELLAKAQTTGRYLEIREGAHRNDVYATEAALVADICVGHKFGATAALEAATAGVRTVIVDSYRTRTRWDAIYSQANIEFDTIDDVLDAVRLYRSGIPGHQALGDWTRILHHFDAFHDGKAVSRLRKIVEECVLGKEVADAPGHR
jgi:hypothetical protein